MAIFHCTILFIQSDYQLSKLPSFFECTRLRIVSKAYPSLRKPISKALKNHENVVSIARKAKLKGLDDENQTSEEGNILQRRQ